MRNYFLQKCLGRPIELDSDAERFLVELDFAWPGNSRHLEHIAARLGLDFIPFVTEEEINLLIGDPNVWHPTKSAFVGAKWTRQT